MPLRPLVGPSGRHAAQILFEDRGILIVNKQAGMDSQSLRRHIKDACSNRLQSTSDWISELSTRAHVSDRLKTVHRLDKNNWRVCPRKAANDDQNLRIAQELSRQFTHRTVDMHIFGDGFLDIVYAVKPERAGQRSIPVINLHPALPGAFDGANALERAYEAFRKGEITETGAMVHRVVKDVDRGEPVVVRRIEMIAGEEQNKFEARVHQVEWEIIVEATKKILQELSEDQAATTASLQEKPT